MTSRNPRLRPPRGSPGGRKKTPPPAPPVQCLRPAFDLGPPSVAGPSGKPSLGRGSSQKRQSRQPDPAPLSRRPAGHSPPFTPAAALTSPGSPALFLLRAVAAAAAPAARPHSSAMSAGSCGDRADEEPLSAAGRWQK